MSAEAKAKQIGGELLVVLDALPASALEVQQRLNLTHEQTYEALVKLESRGAAIVVPTYDKHRSLFTWEPT